VSNYRVYSEEDKARLEQIRMYREAGVPLEQIKGLLDHAGETEEDVLRLRLEEVTKEISLLRLQQKIIVEILKGKNADDKIPMMDSKTFVSILKSSGITDTALDRLHAEFEKRSPKEHQSFLEFLGIDKEAIRFIREDAKNFTNIL
jgi:DNA-binding transcriptional MerR regulator